MTHGCDRSDCVISRTMAAPPPPPARTLMQTMARVAVLEKKLAERGASISFLVRAWEAADQTNDSAEKRVERAAGREKILKNLLMQAELKASKKAAARAAAPPGPPPQWPAAAPLPQAAAPAPPASALQAGVQCLRAGRFAEAASHLEGLPDVGVFARQVADAEQAVAKGGGLLASGRARDAVAAAALLRRFALDTCPGSLQVATLYCRALVGSGGDRPAAAAMAAALAHRHPAEPELQLALGRCHWSDGSEAGYAAAAAAFRAAARLDPDSGAGAGRLARAAAADAAARASGVAAFGCGRFSEAAAAFSEAATQCEGEAWAGPKLLLNRALCSLKLGNYQQAVADATAAAVWAPSWGKPLYVRGAARRCLGLPSPAAADFAAAAALAPADSGFATEVAAVRAQLASNPGVQHPSEQCYL